jgi:hypothetical protein
MIWKSIFDLVDAEVPQFTLQEKASITDAVYDRIDIVHTVWQEIEKYVVENDKFNKNGNIRVEA